MDNVTDKPSFSIWRMLALILVGMALVACAVYAAQRMRLRESFALDWQGTPVQGTVEIIDAERYRLRYEVAAGIMGQTIKGKLPLYQKIVGDGKTLTIMYDPLNPTNFQARGQSFEGTAIAGALFLAGMACVLYARRAAIRAKRASAPPTPPDKREKQRKR